MTEIQNGTLFYFCHLCGFPLECLSHVPRLHFIFKVQLLLIFSDGNIHDVLKVASDYSEPDLITKCESQMIQRCKKTDKPLIHGLVSMLKAADNYKLMKLKEDVMQLAIKRKSHELEASPLFKTLTPETRCKVLSKRLKVFEGLYTKLTKVRSHCCPKHADYFCKICFISTTKECFESLGLCF